jgi:hypothetical protein
MSTESDLNRYRAAANQIRTEISRASNTVATKRKKASDALAAAERSKSATTIRTKTAEADRATRDANDAEKKRAGLEKKLAETEVKITKTQQKYEKERATAQSRALDDLRRGAGQSAERFSPSHFSDTLRERTLRPGPNSLQLRQRPAKDVFLSHATEDKEDIARPLRDALVERSVTVWFDELQMKVGQSIRQEIEAGIAGCRFGVVIVSPHFFAKQWTQAELDALFGKRMDQGQNLVLPIWHHVSKDEVSQHSPLLAGVFALNTAVSTVDEIADSLVEVVRGDS